MQVEQEDMCALQNHCSLVTSITSCAARIMILQAAPIFEGISFDVAKTEYR